MMESDNNCKIGLERTTVVNVLKAVGLRKKQRSSRRATVLCEGHARAAWFVFVVSKLCYTENKMSNFPEL